MNQTADSSATNVKMQYISKNNFQKSVPCVHSREKLHVLGYMPKMHIHVPVIF